MQRSQDQQLQGLLIKQRRVIAGIIAALLFIASLWALLLASNQTDCAGRKMQPTDIPLQSTEHIQALSEAIFQASDYTSRCGCHKQ